MSVLFRLTSIFSGKEQGWAEAICYPAPDGTTPAQFWAATGLPIAQKRKELLGREYTLSSNRIALIRDPAGAEVKRNSLFVTTDFNPSLLTDVNSADQPNVDAVVTGVDATGGRKKHIFLGGIPDGIVTNGGDYDGTGAAGWNSRFNAWAAIVVSASGGWLEDIINIPNIALTGYVQNASKTVTLTFDDALFLPEEVNQVRTIRLKGINVKSALNGQQEVRVDAVNECTTVKPLAVFPFSAGGQGTSYVTPKPYVAAASWEVDRIGTHKRGRPSSARVGRSRARARG